MLTLIIGGAGSGKSAFAEALAKRLSDTGIYLATMKAEDPESLQRIERHRRQRAELGFATVERATGLSEAEIPAGANVLLEDLSNLLANELFSPEGGGPEAVRRGLAALADRCEHLTVISNEVFSGGNAYEGETLAYMGHLARLNRELAAKADLVVEVLCGLPNVLKGELP